MTGFDQTHTGAATTVDIVAALGQLADMSAQEGYYGLQDANLVLLEAIAELQANVSAHLDFVGLLSDWTQSVSQYLTEPSQAVPAVMALLRRPELGVPMADEEFAQLEAQLYKDAPVFDGVAGGNSPISPEYGLPAAAGDALDGAAQWAVLDNLADQAAAKGWFGLQDANLLLAEVLRERPTESLGEGLADLLAAWLQLNERYYASPDQENSAAIIRFLRDPVLDMPLDDDEFALLEKQLVCVAEDSADTAGPMPPAPGISLDLHIANIGRLADHAAAAGFYGLQDANLLLAEALAGLAPERINDGLLALLDSWPELNNRYAGQPGQTAPLIIDFLRQPIGLLALSDDEFADLAAQLKADGTAPVAGQLPAAANPEASLAAISPEADDEEVFFGGLPLQAQELVELLLLETRLVSGHIQAIVMGDSASVQNGLLQAIEEMERFANAATTAGFKGLGQVCKHIGLNLQYFYRHVPLFDADALESVQAWLGQVEEYLPAFNDLSASQLIVSGLVNDHWPIPLTFEQLSDILIQINLESSSVVDESDAAFKQAARLVTASEDDVSLVLPDDVNQELLDILLEELPIYTQQFSEALQGMQAGNRAALDVAQRVAHTLKGSANTVGVRGIAELTHNLEDILIACADAQTLPGPALSAALVKAADCLEGMSETLMGLGSPPHDAKAVLQEILDWANRIDKEGISHCETATEPSPAPLPTVGEEASEPAEKPETQAAMMRVPVGQIENLFRLSGENIILNGQAVETLRRMKQQLQAMQAQFAVLQHLSAELEQLVDLKDLSGRALVAAADFDALEMDQYNELHTASRRLIEAAVDAREMNLDAQKELAQLDVVLDDQQRLMIDTQEAIMKTRLVPVSTISPRLQRALRQTCRLTGKQSELSLSGGHLLIDSDLLNSMVDPLMHLLRNAIDHGIEDEAGRLQNGKPAIGHIAIRFEREGNSILVTCQDDGRGLDFAAIRAAAERRGVLTPGQAASEEDLQRLILRPNFSTRTQSTQISGRGVGMDAVYFQILNLGGTLALHSQAGLGLTVELRMPLPLSRSHALLAKAGNYRVAIANKGITQVFYSGAGEFIDIDGQPFLQFEAVTYPVVPLNQLLRVPRNPRQLQSHGAVLLVQNEAAITAVLLDGIFDSLDIVVKNFGYYLNKIPGFMGAAIMGDGSVAPVLDVPELLRTSVAAWDLEAIGQAEEELAGTLLPTILVVDDSLSQRRAMGQLLGDAGFKVITAGDGIEAVNLLKQTRPDVVLTDLEMPRMNGIELTAHIRSQTKLKGLPVIMITSRTTQKHRKMAEEAGIDFYLAKPVREHDLLAKIQMLMEAPAQF